jgi:predicted Zn-dependent protease
MSGFFYNLGRNVGATLRKGQWVLQSVTGSEDDAIRAEFEVGRDMAWGMMQQLEAETDPAVGPWLQAIGTQLADRVRNRQRRFCFCAVRAPEINAFALPGGFIFITRPLLELCQADPDEVAFILAHEMGHVLHGHAMERILQGWMVEAASRAMPIGGIAGTWLRQQAATLVHQAYSREQELDADLLGVRLARSAGFDPEAAVRLLFRLQGTGGPEHPFGPYFASHPPFDGRIAHVNQLLHT